MVGKDGKCGKHVGKSGKCGKHVVKYGKHMEKHMEKGWKNDVMMKQDPSSGT